MNVTRHRKIFHYHIPKCGGTSVGWWLSQYTSDRRQPDFLPLKRVHDAFLGFTPAAEIRDMERRAKADRVQIFYAADIVSAHDPLFAEAPEGTFFLTVLRDPVARILSKIADWRRLNVADYPDLAGEERDIVADARRLDVRAYLEKHRKVPLINNYISRALALPALGAEVALEGDLSHILGAAKDTLASKFHFVGIAEQAESTLNRLADLLGLPPERHPPRMNRTDSATSLAQEAQAAKDILDEMTAYDRVLYDLAFQRFQASGDAGLGDAYSREQFEARYAAATVNQLEGSERNGDIVFSVRDPLVGSGYHGRDGAGLEACCVWSGPSTTCLLYMPTPPGSRLLVKLWVRGYATAAQRERLRVRVDGSVNEHRFESAPGYAEVLVVEARPIRSFIAVELDVGETVTTGERGTPNFDPRKRGIAFDRYGWRVVND